MKQSSDQTKILAKNSAIVFAGSMGANIISYVYHLLLGRMLGPSGYGELSSLFSILYIFTVPLLVGQTVLVKFISNIKATGTLSQAKSLFIGVTKMCLLGCVAMIPIVILFSGTITQFLHLSSPILFILVYLLFVVTLLSTITASVLQGYQQFMWFSVLTLVVLIIKVILSVSFVPWGVTGVLIAAIIASVSVYGVYYFPLKDMLNTTSTTPGIEKKDALRFGIPTLLSLLGITSLYTTDIILVRHYFSSAEAGMYAAIAILGKIIYYASSAVSQVMFPVLSEKVAKKQTTNTLIMTSLLSVTAISAVLSGLYFLFPEFIVKMLFGNAYAGAAGVLGQFGMFIALFSIGNIITMANLAIGRTGVWFVPIICAILQIISIMYHHTTILSVIAVNIGVSTLLVIGTIGYYMIHSYEKI